MRLSDILRLIVLAAIWGGSFIFMRVLAPVLGPVVTADMRVLIAGIALVLYFRVIKHDLDWRRYWKQYLIIGGVNSALPFFLFSFAALHIPGSFSAILNSSSPLFAAVFSAMWLGERLTPMKVLGLLVGSAGVVLVVKIGAVATDSMFIWSVVACTVAAICYGLAATYIRRFCREIKSKSIAAGSQVMAGLLLLPVIPLSPVRGSVTLLVAGGVVVFALLCSAIAYLIYYKLIADVGPTKALTVTFLMPVFGMIWGVIFLHEIITLSMVVGATLIIIGSGLVLNVVRIGWLTSLTRPADTR